MKSIRLVAPVIVLAATLAGCGAQSVAPAQVQASAPAQARYFDRFEAAVTHDPETGIACLEVTAKGLVSRFTDEDFTLIQSTPGDGDAPEQHALFTSRLYLGQDGRLYLRESQRASDRFYQVGTYRQSRGGLNFKLAEGLKMEARNRSLVPVHGAGPYIAIVVETMPMPLTHVPSLVRRGH